MVPKNDEFSGAFPATFFLDLGLQNTSQNHPKSLKIAPRSEKRDFVKIIVFLKEKQVFSGFGPPKNRGKLEKIVTKTRPRKKHRFFSDFLRFVRNLGIPGAAKIDKKRVQKNIRKKSVSNRAVPNGTR